ncbi:hypothetical protein [Nocardia nova]|uniref:hypothetical protein n=1 Tax=Nocardia nova TaxID=37330 RepID=UPI0025B25AE4|nr:hypothetical protein [Nocardia nova]
MDKTAEQAGIGMVKCAELSILSVNDYTLDLDSMDIPAGFDFGGWNLLSLR